MSIRATLPEARKYRELLDSLSAADGAYAARSTGGAASSTVDASTMTTASAGSRNKSLSTIAGASAAAAASPAAVAARQEEKLQQLIMRDLLQPTAAAATDNADGIRALNASIAAAGGGGASSSAGAVKGHRGSSALHQQPLPAVAASSPSPSSPASGYLNGSAANNSNNNNGYTYNYNPYNIPLKGDTIDDVPFGYGANTTINRLRPGAPTWPSARPHHIRPESAGPHPLAGTSSAAAPLQGGGGGIYGRDAREPTLRPAAAATAAFSVTYTATRPNTVGAIPYASTWTAGGRPIPSPSTNNATMLFSGAGIHGANSANHGGGRPRNLPALAAGVATSAPPAEGLGAPAFIAVSPASVFDRSNPKFAPQPQPQPGAYPSVVSNNSSGIGVSSLDDLLRDQRAALEAESAAFAGHKEEKAAVMQSMGPHDDPAYAPARTVNTLQQRRLKAEAEAKKATEKAERRRLRRREKRRQLRAAAAVETAAAEAEKAAIFGGDEEAVVAMSGTVEEATPTKDAATAVVVPTKEKSSSAATTVAVPPSLSYERRRDDATKGGGPKSFTEQFLGESVRRILAERAGGVGADGEEPYSAYDDRAYRGGNNSKITNRTATNAKGEKAAVTDAASAYALATTDPGRLSLKAMLSASSTAAEDKTAGHMLLKKEDGGDSDGGDSSDEFDEDVYSADSSSSEDEAEAAARIAAEAEAAAAAAAEAARRLEAGRAAPYSLVEAHVAEQQARDVSIRLRHLGVSESEGFVSTIFGYSPTRQRLAAHATPAGQSRGGNVSGVGGELPKGSNVPELPASPTSPQRLRALLGEQTRAMTPAAGDARSTASSSAVGSPSSAVSAQTRILVSGGVPSDVVSRNGAARSGFSVVLRHKNVLADPTAAPSATAAHLPTLRQPQPSLEAAVSARCPAIYYTPPVQAAIEAAEAAIRDGGGDPNDIDGPFSAAALRAKAISAAVIGDYKSDRRRQKRSNNNGGAKAEEDGEERNAAEAGSPNKAEVTVETAAAPLPLASTVASTDAPGNHLVAAGDASDALRRASHATTNSHSYSLAPVDLSAIAAAGVIAAEEHEEGSSSNNAVAPPHPHPLSGALASAPPSRLGHSTIDGRPRPTTSDDPFSVIDLGLDPLAKGGGGGDEDDPFPQRPAGMPADDGLGDEDGDFLDDDVSRPVTSQTHQITQGGGGADADEREACDDDDGIRDDDEEEEEGQKGGADPSVPIMVNHPDAPRDPTTTDVAHLALEVRAYDLEDELRGVDAAARGLLQSREAVTALRAESRGRHAALVKELSAVEAELQTAIDAAAPRYAAERLKKEAEERRNDPRRTIQAKTPAGAVWGGDHPSLEAALDADRHAKVTEKDRLDTAEATRAGYLRMRTEALARLEASVEPPCRTAIANAESAAFGVLRSICVDALLQETVQRRTIMREEREHRRAMVSYVAAERHRTECAVWMPSLLKPHERYDRHMLPIRPSTVATTTNTSAAADAKGRVGMLLDVSSSSAAASSPNGTRKKSVDFRDGAEVTPFAADEPATAVSPLRPYTAPTVAATEDDDEARKKAAFAAAADAHQQRLRSRWALEQADREALLRLQRDKLQWKQEKRTLKRLFFEACAAAELLPSDVEMIGADGATAALVVRRGPSSPSAGDTNVAANASISADAKAFFGAGGSPTKAAALSGTPAAAEAVVEEEVVPLSPAEVAKASDTSTSALLARMAYTADDDLQRPATAVTDADDVVMQYTTTAPSPTRRVVGGGGEGGGAEAAPPYFTYDPRAATPATPAFGKRRPLRELQQQQQQDESAAVNNSNKTTEEEGDENDDKDLATADAAVGGAIPTTPRRQEVLRLRQRLEYVQWALDDVEQKEEAMKRKMFAKGVPAAEHAANVAAAASSVGSPSLPSGALGDSSA